MTILNSIKEGKLEEPEKEEKTKEMQAVKQSNKESEEEEGSKGTANEEEQTESSSDEKEGGSGWVRLLAKIDLVHVFLYSQKLGKVMTLNLKGEGNGNQKGVLVGGSSCCCSKAGVESRILYGIGVRRFRQCNNPGGGAGF